jgi:hypothetical protein
VGRDRADLTRHEEARCEVAAPPAAVFEHIDRPERLSAHMSQKSWQLAGSSMSIETDASGGRVPGSRIRLRGRMLGIALAVECVVVTRIPPEIKGWETVGTPRLLVIGPYRMAVRIAPHNGGSRVTIAIDYAMLTGRWERLLAGALGPHYARWCVRQMARDLVLRFSGSSTK